MARFGGSLQANRDWPALSEQGQYTALRDVITREGRNFVRKAVDVFQGRQGSYQCTYIDITYPIPRDAPVR